MAYGYRFGPRPIIGSTVHAFRSEAGLRAFSHMQGGGMRLWGMTGTIISDDGGEDGLIINVDSVWEL